MKDYLPLLRKALIEDIGKGDITTNNLVCAGQKARAVILFKQPAVICGLGLAKNIFRLLDRDIKFQIKHKDGDWVKAGTKVAYIEGKARAILPAERVALNFLSHLSGIATLTRQFVEQVKPYKVEITDTRKTLPGLRQLQKYAVRCGGGYNHRFSLNEMVMIKDNHKKILANKLGIRDLIKSSRQKSGSKMVEIEVENLQEYQQALLAKPDIIMLDNMELSDIKKAVRMKLNSPRFKTIRLEVSGKVSLNKVRQIAKTGVDMISVGSLTHSAAAIDVSLEVR